MGELIVTDGPLPVNGTGGVLVVTHVEGDTVYIGDDERVSPTVYDAQLTAGGSLTIGGSTKWLVTQRAGRARLHGTSDEGAPAAFKVLGLPVDGYVPAFNAAKHASFWTAPPTGPLVSAMKFDGDFVVVGGAPNQGQVMIAPVAATSPAGVAQFTLVPNDAPASLQDRNATIAFHPERNHVEDATIKCHRHVDGGGVPTDRHIQIHTKNAAGTDLLSRLEIQYLVEDAYFLLTSCHLMFDNNAYIKPRNAGQNIRFKNAANTRSNIEIEDSGVLSIIGEAGTFTATATAGGGQLLTGLTVREWWTIRTPTGLGKVPVLAP